MIPQSLDEPGCFAVWYKPNTGRTFGPVSETPRYSHLVRILYHKRQAAHRLATRTVKETHPQKRLTPFLPLFAFIIPQLSEEGEPCLILLIFVHFRSILLCGQSTGRHQNPGDTGVLRRSTVPVGIRRSGLAAGYFVRLSRICLKNTLHDKRPRGRKSARPFSFFQWYSLLGTLSNTGRPKYGFSSAELGNIR